MTLGTETIVKTMYRQILVATALVFTTTTARAADPLPSWNNTQQ